MTRHAHFKVNKGESLKHKLAKPQTFRKFDKVEKGAILGFLIIAVAFIPAFAYYTNNIANTAKDPWNTLWNGTFNQTTATTVIHDFANGISFGDHAANSHVEFGGDSGLTVSTGEAIIFGIQSVGNALCNFNITITPALSNYQQFSCETNLYGAGVGTNHLYANSWHGGFTTSDTPLNITISSTAARSFGGYVNGYLNAATMIDANPITNLNCCNPDPTPTVTISATTSNFGRVISQDMIYGQFVVTSKNRALASGCHTVTSSGTLRNTTCDNGFSSFGSNNAFASADLDGASYITAGHINFIYSGNDDPAIYLEDVSYFAVLLTWKGDAPAGFNCFGAHTNTDGTIDLLDRGTGQTPTCISNNPIDFSIAASKQIGIFEEFLSHSTPPTNNVYVNESWGWYLTLNDTNPTGTNSYDPGHDGLVALELVQYVANVTAGKPDLVNTYVYMQKQIGQQLIPDSGVGVNPYPKCVTSSTLYLCGQDRQPASGQSTASLVLNMTGQDISGSTAGYSFYCTSHRSATGLFCDLGGSNGQQIHIADTNQLISQIFPWFNSQTKYHMGFFLKARGDNTSHNITVGNPSLASDVISAFEPAASVATDTGSFFGWIGSVLGGTFDQIGGFFSPLISPLVGIGNSFMSAIILGFAQSVALLIQGFRILLNAIGNIVGFGNFGDLLISTFAAIGSLIVSGFSAIIGFFTGLGSIISSGYFTFLAGAAVLIGTLLPLAIVLWNIIFNGAFTVTDILFFDYVFGMFLVSKAIKEHKSSLKAFLGWVSFNVFIFTFVFNAAWTVFDIVTRPILRTKQTVDPVG